ncbi:MAG: glycerophosphodiester phosphodiesterase [Verrucomicrobia bacterium]|nr:glycerophosphodiester phosphodiesterase [Verrucomicrobiota bacterium]
MTTFFSRTSVVIGAALFALLPTVIAKPDAIAASSKVNTNPYIMPEIVAHRGASYSAPENTLPSFELAWKEGADAIEGDFYLTKDGKIICTHDDTTERVTGGTDNRAIAEGTFDDLRQLDVGSWKGEQWKGVRMPSLDEVLATIPAGKKLLIEVKCGPEIVPALKATVEGWSAEQLRIISFNADVITTCRRELPAIKAFWLTGYKEQTEGSGNWQPSFDSVMKQLHQTKASGLDSSAHETIDETLVQRLRAADLEFHVWTVDDPVVAKRFANLGVDSITTNRPAWLREQLSREVAIDTEPAPEQ